MANFQIPWWGKILAKICLSRLPISYDFWRKLGVFRHGEMDQFEYSIRIFENHCLAADILSNMQGKHILELGPGDSINSAILASSKGARVTLIDSGSFANKDVAAYKKFASYLTKKGLSAPDLTAAKNIEDVLEICGALYFTDGRESFCKIRDNSVHLIFSQAVLEHINKYEFQSMMEECYRVLVPGGKASHRIDLRDHLGGALNNLRFSEKLWESKFFSSSGFYTNRLRWPEFLESFNNASFKEVKSELEKWDTLPTRYQDLNESFKLFSEKDLLVKGANIILIANK